MHAEIFFHITENTLTTTSSVPEEIKVFKKQPGEDLFKKPHTMFPLYTHPFLNTQL